MPRIPSFDFIEDVKPPDCGLADESWYICLLNGQWSCWSDAGEPSLMTPHYVASEEEARDFWDDAAEAYRSTRA